MKKIIEPFIFFGNFIILTFSFKDLADYYLGFSIRPFFNPEINNLGAAWIFAIISFSTMFYILHNIVNRKIK